MIRVAGVWLIFVGIFVLVTVVSPISGPLANSVAAFLGVTGCVLIFKGRTFLTVLPPLFAVTVLLPVVVLVLVGGDGLSGIKALASSLDIYSYLTLACPFAVGASASYAFGRGYARSPV